MMNKILCVGLLLVSVGATAQAQVRPSISCPAEAPVLLQANDVSGGKAVVTISNKGPRAITAVILGWKVLDSLGTAPSVDSETIDFAPSGTFFEPGRSTQSDYTIALKSGASLKSVEVSCLAVLFEGKAMYGDPKTPEVVRLRTVRQGIASERNRLLAVYNAEGLTRLLQEINRTVAR